MQRDVPFEVGEIYHAYNRGAHKENIFTQHIDYARFQLLMYLGNSKKSVNLRNVLRKYDKGRTFVKIYEEMEVPAEERLVDVLAYTLMPNHFHFVLRQRQEDGIYRYVQKVATAYSMYFNAKYEHSGTIFQGKFKSKHAEDDDYLRWLFAYVYANPLEIKKDILKYPYSSFTDVCAKQRRPESRIISWESLMELGDDHPAEVGDIKRLTKVGPLSD